jgi:hypothetical protein
VHRVRVLAASVLAVTFGAQAALAVSITNRDDREYKITVVEGDSAKDYVLQPSGMLDGICANGCVIRLGDSDTDEYELEGDEVLSLEDGELYYDGPDASDPVPGDTGKSTGPKK